MEVPKIITEDPVAVEGANTQTTTEVTISPKSMTRNVDSHKTVLKDNRKHKKHHSNGSFLLTCLGALGVVYGDIGTSPLYTMESIFANGPPSKEDVMGVTCLMCYVITLVVCIKYLIFVMRADYNGAGGVFALLSQILYGNSAGLNAHNMNSIDAKLNSIASSRNNSLVDLASAGDPEVNPPVKFFLHNIKVRKAFLFIAMVGSGLLLGDGVITPAISVLSAIEGLSTVNSSLTPAVVPITCVLLFLLFMMQRFGTAKVGFLFGPIMVIWFFTLTIMGIYQISMYPSIFAALNPYAGISFFIRNGYDSWVDLGAIVLCITGCEAMFADMGHFGKNAVRASWIFFVYPALLFNYLGQGALLIRDPDSVNNPFFNMLPQAVFWPVFIISIAATIIASQALISGAFSLTQQAVSMGYFPRLPIVQTSAYMEGQIYIPTINYILMICGIALVAGFQSSARLASAYGVAVCGDMLLTSFMFLTLARFRWRWHIVPIVWLAIEFGVVDLAFLSSNLRKVPSGGWFPLLFAVVVFCLMFVWYRGEKVLHEIIHKDQAPFEDFVEQLKLGKVGRCAGVGIFMSAVEQGIPSVLTQFLQHMPVLPEATIFLTLKRLRTPYVPLSRSRVIALPEGCIRIVLEIGFMENKFSLEELVDVMNMHGVALKLDKGTFFLGNEIVSPTEDRWFFTKIYVELYNLLLQYSHKSTAVGFGIPPKQVVYVGSHYSI